MSALRMRRSSRLREIVLWDRDRWQGQHVTADIGGVCAVVVGHTPLREVRVRGNVINIDRGAEFRPYGNLTVLDLAEIPAMLAKKEDR
jgi:serine/threonine protein phosphatase 1